MLRKKSNMGKKSPNNLLRLSNTNVPITRKISPNSHISMEDKLKSLKEKIAQKKTLSSTKAEFFTPNKKVTAEAIKFLSNKCSPANNSFQEDIPINESQFSNFLKDNKMDNHLQVFLDSGIHTKQYLFQKTDQQIDSLKQLPIGYRIKIKMLVLRNSKMKSTKVSEFSSKDIEAIIKQRNQSKVFRQLKYEIQDQTNQFGNEDDQGAEIIQKIANFFNWENRNKIAKDIAINKVDKTEQHGYCWECLRPVDSRIQQQCGDDSKILCSSECLDEYRVRLRVDQQMILENQLAEKQLTRTSRQDKRDQQPVNQQQYIDLMLM